MNITSSARRKRDALARLAHTLPDIHAEKIAEFFSSRSGGEFPETLHFHDVEGIKSYIICFVNRSGSNLLVAALQATGSMGAPKEFFDYARVIEAASRDGINSLEHYTRSIMRANSTPNGVFGTKLGSGQLYYLTREEIIPSILQEPVFIYVTRRDIVAQAVSFVIASQTSRWTSKLKGNGVEPTYDPEAILANLQWIGESQSRFELYFAMHRIRPLRFVYEEIETALQDAVTQIAVALELHPIPAFVREQIQIHRQRTELNDEFKARFLEDLKPGT